MGEARGNWGSQLAFVMAAAGSAIGLGNIWRFPYLVGVHGGGAFIALYVACGLTVGLPLMLAEIVIGRSTQRDVVGAFRSLPTHRAWSVIGFLGLAAGFVILSFYSVVGGWSIEYLWQTVSGSYWGTPADQFSTRFGDFIADYHRPLGWHVLFMALVVGIVIGGVKDGIEYWNKILMPTLFLLLLVIVVKVATLPGAWDGYRFLVTCDWGAVAKPEVVLRALGQAFFSLSLGMGAMLTYGSYLKRGEDVPKAGLWVVVADSAASVLATFAIFPAVFAFGMKPGEGPGLVFCTFPKIFTEMTGGRVVGTLFFACLLIAAITSAISLLEVVVAVFIDGYGWPRRRTTVGMAALIALLGVPCALSFAPATAACPLGMKAVAIPFPGGPFTFFDLMEHVASNLFLPLGGFLLCLYAGWVWGTRAVLRELSDGRPGFEAGLAGAVWAFMIRYVSPLLVAMVLAYSFKLVSFVDGRMVFFQGWR